MRVQRRTSIFLLALFGLAVLLTTSCVDEKIVFRDRVLYEDPPSAAMGMVGYSEVEAKLTVCGNCHVGQQSEWEGSGHAGAWAGLQDSGHAQDFCDACHTVNELGNELSQPSGYLAVEDIRYTDVQCESCHGPGLGHVENPDATQPLAPIDVGTDLVFGCGECHEGTHHPFASEWAESGHARVISYAASRPECASCHEGKGALAAFNVTADYLEKGSPESMPITCAVCHDPHGSSFEGQLRFPVQTASVEQHMCAQCHDRRTEPNPASSHGLHPHSPHTAMLQGEAGWFPPNVRIERGEIIASHGAEGNEGLCATCHVDAFEITDQSTGEFVFNATGHLFKAIPCVDQQGVPTTGDCGLNLDDRAFRGCATGACHGGSVQGAYSAMVTATTRLENLAEELHDLLLLVDPNGEDSGGAIDAGNPTFTVAEGAYFNWALAAFGGEDRPDTRLTYAAAAAHNPFLMEQLLIASINVVEDEYGVQASPSLSRDRALTGHSVGLQVHGLE